MPQKSPTNENLILRPCLMKSLLAELKILAEAGLHSVVLKLGNQSCLIKDLANSGSILYILTHGNLIHTAADFLLPRPQTILSKSLTVYFSVVVVLSPRNCQTVRINYSKKNFFKKAS